MPTISQPSSPTEMIRSTLMLIPASEGCSLPEGKQDAIFESRGVNGNH